MSSRETAGRVERSEPRQGKDEGGRMKDEGGIGGFASRRSCLSITPNAAFSPLGFHPSSFILHPFALILFAALAALPADAAPWATGPEFQQQLSRPAGILWSGNRLRQALGSLSREKRTATLLDRRVDPEEKIDAQFADVSLRDALQQIAASRGLGILDFGVGRVHRTSGGGGAVADPGRAPRRRLRGDCRRRRGGNFSGPNRCNGTTLPSRANCSPGWRRKTASN